MVKSVNLRIKKNTEGQKICQKHFSENRKEGRL